MPQGMGRRVRRMISGLLLLSVFALSVFAPSVLAPSVLAPSVLAPSVLAMSIVQADAAVLPITHVAIGTSAAIHQDIAADAVAPFPTPHHIGWPCEGHETRGLACCGISGCPTISAGLPGPTMASPAIMPTTLAYLDSSPVRPDGLQFAPTVPPPRRAPLGASLWRSV